ncbi:MAG: CBS domain-containing protein [Bilophila wadsworthia]
MIYVSDLMTSRVFTLRRTDTLQDVRSLMQLAKIRHIPVTEDGDRFVGLLTHRDLLGYAVSHLAEINREEQEEIESSFWSATSAQTDVRTLRPIPSGKRRDPLPEQYGCLPSSMGTKTRWHHYRSRFPASGHRTAARRLIFHYIKPLEPPSSPSAL